jgi:hypothetical protein
MHRLLPAPLVIPIEFQSGTTSLLYTENIFNNESLGVSLQTDFLQAYTLSAGYRFTYNYNDIEGPSSLVHSLSLLGSRSGKIPSRARLALGLVNLDSLVLPQNDRFSYLYTTMLNQDLSLGGYGSVTLSYSFSNREYLNITRLNRSHTLDVVYSKSPYGTLDLGYTLTVNKETVRQEQSGKDHRFSLGYLNILFRKLEVNTGFDYTTSTFDTPRFFGTGTGSPPISTIEKNNTYSFRLGTTYPLGSGLNFSMNYTWTLNLSNLDFSRPAENEVERLRRQQLEDQFRFLGDYQKHVISLSVGKSF